MCLQPRKRNWKRSYLNDKEVIHFCRTAYFLAVYANGKYTGTSSIAIVSRCKFLHHPASIPVPITPEITRRVAILVLSSLLCPQLYVFVRFPRVDALCTVSEAALAVFNAKQPKYFSSDLSAEIS